MLILIKFHQCYNKKSVINIKLVNRNNSLHALYLMFTGMIYDKKLYISYIYDIYMMSNVTHI